LFNWWIKKRSEKTLDKLCKITKNTFERHEKISKLANEWKKATGSRRKELATEHVCLLLNSSSSDMGCGGECGGSRNTRSVDKPKVGVACDSHYRSDMLGTVVL
jgi:hypothetical protein